MLSFGDIASPTQFVEAQATAIRTKAVSIVVYVGAAM